MIRGLGGLGRSVVRGLGVWAGVWLGDEEGWGAVVRQKQKGGLPCKLCRVTAGTGEGNRLCNRYGWHRGGEGSWGHDGIHVERTHKGRRGGITTILTLLALGV